MEFRENKIILDRELSGLDRFTFDFIQVLDKYSRYVIISGYVSILLGRSRGSEDIDMIIPKMDKESFERMLKDLSENGFYCLNAESLDEIYEYLVQDTAIRFAKHNTVIPNMEVKFIKNRFEQIALDKSIEVEIGDRKIMISELELQIVFKEKVLKSPKDLEDARHLREVAKDHIDRLLIHKYEVMLEDV